jgi:hypothetical protein
MVQSDAKDRENPGKTASTLEMSISKSVSEAFLLLEMCSKVAQIQGIPPGRIRATDMSVFLATSHGAI